MKTELERNKIYREALKKIDLDKHMCGCEALFSCIFERYTRLRDHYPRMPELFPEYELFNPSTEYTHKRWFSEPEIEPEHLQRSIALEFCIEMTNP